MTEVNGKKGFSPTEMGGSLTGTQMAQRQIKVMELGCIAMVQGGNLVLALGSTQQYSRQKCMPLRHAQLRI
jgi:hypothetical protein